jgi:hypothetical protein
MGTHVAAARWARTWQRAWPPPPPAPRRPSRSRVRGRCQRPLKTSVDMLIVTPRAAGRVPVPSPETGWDLAVAALLRRISEQRSAVGEQRGRQHLDRECVRDWEGAGRQAASRRATRRPASGPGGCRARDWTSRPRDSPGDHERPPTESVSRAPIELTVRARGVRLAGHHGRRF